MPRRPMWLAITQRTDSAWIRDHSDACRRKNLMRPSLPDFVAGGQAGASMCAYFWAPVHPWSRVPFSSASMRFFAAFS